MLNQQLGAYGSLQMNPALVGQHLGCVQVLLSHQEICNRGDPGVRLLVD
jgi:hypothetical protein